MNDQLQPSSPTDFKKKAAGVTLLLPSGLVVVCKRIDLKTYLAKADGAVPNSLMGMVQESLDRGKPQPEITDPESLEGMSMDTIREMFEMMEGMIIAAVQQPSIHPAPGPRDERREDQVYIDEVEEEDKMFLFDWLNGGTSDVESFREKARADLVALAEIKSSGGTAE